MNETCAFCGKPATHRFFAERVSKNGNKVENIKNYGLYFQKDLLKHDRYRFSCIGCYESAKEKLEKMSFSVQQLESL